MKTNSNILILFTALFFLTSLYACGGQGEMSGGAIIDPFEIGDDIFQNEITCVDCEESLEDWSEDVTDNNNTDTENIQGEPGKYRIDDDKDDLDIEEQIEGNIDASDGDNSEDDKIVKKYKEDLYEKETSIQNKENILQDGSIMITRTQLVNQSIKEIRKNGSSAQSKKEFKKSKQKLPLSR